MCKLNTGENSATKFLGQDSDQFCKFFKDTAEM